MKDVLDGRVNDPGRGFFCATTKKGQPLNAPPSRREPIVDRERNPRGVRRPNKTSDDLRPVPERRRYQAWLKRLQSQ